MRCVLIGLLVFCACSAAPKPGTDAGEPADSGTPPDAGSDAGTDQDAGVPAAPTHLGVSRENDTLIFRLASAGATRVQLELFRDARDAGSVLSQTLERGTDGVFETRVALSDVPGSALDTPLYYGYRAWGPNWPYQSSWRPGLLDGWVSDVDSTGYRFNPNKLLFDPYALELSHDPNQPGIDGRVYSTDAAHRSLDSATFAAKGLVMFADAPDAGTRPMQPLADDAIYEVHLRGLTENDPSVPANLQGTYAGAALKAQWLAQLGVTAVEFLPLQETQNDQNDVDPGSDDGDNYWGYSTLAYFAPDRHYSSDRSPGGPTRELRAMVRAFHDAGLKVFVDVVYNHTGEPGLTTFRGLDNPSYYSLSADRSKPYDNTGVSGNFNTYNPIAQTLIIDSLRYWHDVLGADGFRFDLAPVLGNTCEHACFNYSKTDPKTALNRIVKVLGVRPANGGAGLDLIAEPWAIGNGTYQLGNFPSGWSEWNGQFRDQLRQAQNQLGVVSLTPLQLLHKLSGSFDLYGDDGRKPGASVNFLVCHDGFTLKDVYSCNTKNNGQAWPYGPSNGGTDDNFSWDHNGDAVAQRRAARTGLALTLLSAGAAMITGGDEQLRTLKCNNNSYNLDSVATWLGWAPDTDQQSFETFTQRLLAFRKAHPALHPHDWYPIVDQDGDGIEGMKWLQPSGAGADDAYLNNANNHAFGWRLDGSELGDPAAALWVAYNGWTSAVNFTLPKAPPGTKWFRVTDTCSGFESPDQFANPGGEFALGDPGQTYSLCSRGLTLMLAR
ncbi:MAG: isoamylase [Myxococcaceae bacterium]